MKKVFTLLALVFSAMGIQAQTAVPVPVSTAFNQTYTNVQPTWNNVNGNFVASFAQNSHDMNVTYTPVGEWKRTETIITQAELPTAANEFLTTRFLVQGSDYQLIKTTTTETSEGTFKVAHLTTSGRSINLFFDNAGTLIRREVQ